MMRGRGYVGAPALVVAALLGAARVDAQPLRSDDRALAGYVEQARQHNRELGAREREVEQRRARRAATNAGYLPSLDLEARYTKTYGNALDLGDFLNPANEVLNQVVGEPRFPTDFEFLLPFPYDAKLRLTQPVFAPALLAGSRLASAGVQAAEAEHSVAERDIVTAVRVAYLQHARAAMAAKVLEESVPLYEEGLRLAKVLTKADKATGEAVPRARAELAEIEQQLREVERLRARAARQLNLLVGAPIDQPVPDAALDVIELPKSVEPLVSAARQSRAELAVITAGKRARSAERQLAVAAFLPSVALVVDYGVQSQSRPDLDDDYLAVSVVASWNLFAGGRDAANARAARLEREALEMRRLQLADQIELEVRQAWDDAVTARKAIESGDVRIASAETAFDVVLRRYKSGSAPQYELMAARTALLQARTDRSLAVAELHLRLVELERVATGEEVP